MARRPLAAAVASGILVIILWGCGAAATPIPSTGAASPAAASQAAASVEASAAEPSVAAASGAAGSPAAASIALPSLPSEAKDLEALLPDTICGAKATKLSMNGASFLSSAGSEFSSALSALGKTPADVSVAVAGGTTGCSAVVFRIAGVDQNSLQTAIMAAVPKGGTAPTQTTIGGKTVFAVTDASGKKSLVYFKNDTVFIAEAASDADAAALLQAFP
jgi:hypothetical protein